MGVMVPTRLQMTDFSPKWGHVMVLGPSGDLAREYRITAIEEAGVRNGASCPGCTAEEWSSGRVHVIGRVLLPGQAVINPNGTLWVNDGEDHNATNIGLSIKAFAQDAWLVCDGIVYVDQDAYRQLERERHNGCFG